MPVPKITKPRPWPPSGRKASLGLHGGSWQWDEGRAEPLGIKFTLPDGRRTTVRSGVSVIDCIAKRDALRAEVEAKLDKHRRLRNGDATVGELLESWFGYIDGARASKTRDTYEDSIKRIQRTELIPMRASEVTRGDVQDAYLVLVRDHDYGESSMSKVRSHLGMAYDWGIIQGYAATNPVRGTKFPGMMRRVAKPQWLDKDAFKRVLGHLAAEPTTTVELALMTMLLTGMRPGEVLGLCWDKVDLDTGVAEIEREIQRSNRGRTCTLVDALKNPQSKRIVELPPALVRALGRHRREQLRCQLAAKVWHSSELVFTREDGRSLRFNLLDAACRRACRAVGVAPLSPNKLRHSHLSLLLERNQPMPQVAAHAGHKNSRMLITTYAHPMKAQVPTAEVLADIL